MVIVRTIKRKIEGGCSPYPKIETVISFNIKFVITNISFVFQRIIEISQFI